MKKTALILTMLLAFAAGNVNSQNYPFQNPSLPAEQRADDLISRLTIDEKVSLMMHQSPEIERLGIPRFHWWNEALHGVARNGLATVFPNTTGMAASFDDALLSDVFSAVSDEARAKYNVAKRTGDLQQYQCLSFWTPNINIFRDPRWGRGQETYGEDPYLMTRMGLAVVRGLQGPEDSKYMKTLACAKHFAVHSGPEWNRHSFDISDLSERDLWETYLPAFKALVQEGNVAEVMCAYQSMDGEPCCGNSRYLQQILRKDWGFNGLVTSDCWAINDFYEPGRHGAADNATDASAMALRAGTDLECGPNFASLADAVKSGQVTEKEIDASLKRLILARIALGDLDPEEMVDWNRIPESVIASEENGQLALQMARESIVLLQNNGNLLPLDAGKGLKIAVMGANATDSAMQWANYNGIPRHTITILDGIKAKYPDVKYIDGVGLTQNGTSGSRWSDILAPEGRIGIKARYWNNEQLKGESVKQQYIPTPLQLNNGGATAFAQGVNLYHFSAKYEGILNSRHDETVNFEISADDGVRLYLDGKLVCDNWNQGQVDLKYPVEVKNGQKLVFCVEYRQAADEARISFDITTGTRISEQDIIAQAADADVIIFVGGISPRLEGEEMTVAVDGFKGGDRTKIELPASQRKLVEALHGLGKKIVFVNCSGGAVGLTNESHNADAILQAWYGGQAGGQALAEVLFGDVNPSGKLPLTFYHNTEQLPDFLDYSMKGRTYRYFTGKPLFAFGHGLSYTSFKIKRAKFKNGVLTCKVRNTGKRDGTEVVQVYLHRTEDKEGPIRTLRAFQRVELKAHRSQKIRIEMPESSFECWDEATGTMRVLPGNYEIEVGNASDCIARVLKIKL